MKRPIGPSRGATRGREVRVKWQFGSPLASAIMPIFVIALNSYREALRARTLHALALMAVASAAYCLVVGQYTSGAAPRVVADLGAAATSLYAVGVTIVLSATMLHREIEQRTLYPMLARPLSRSEYLLGKYLGIALTAGSFILVSTALFAGALTVLSERPMWHVLLLLSVVGGGAVGATLRWRAHDVAIICSAIAVLGLGTWALAGSFPDDRRLLFLSAGFAWCEVAIVAAIAMLFSSFSSAALTAILTLGLLIVGRSADTLAKLPPRIFGQAIHDAGHLLSRVLPNLMVYVPSRAWLGLVGEAATSFFAWGVLQACAWSLGLLVVACAVFRRRDLV